THVRLCDGQGPGVGPVHQVLRLPEYELPAQVRAVIPGAVLRAVVVPATGGVGLASEHPQIGGHQVVRAGLRVAHQVGVAHTGGPQIGGQDRFSVVEAIPLGGVVTAAEVEVDLLRIAVGV